MNRLFLNILLTAVLMLVGCKDVTKVESVNISPSALDLSVGEQYQLEMIVLPISATIYNPTSWSSSDPDVATVDHNGVVTAVYAGECVITGQAMHTKGECKVTVETPKYGFEFKNAVIFNNGNNSETGSDNLELMLYNDDLQIDSTGAVSGNGAFLSLSMYAPLSEQKLPAGEYGMTVSGESYSVMPGELKEENGIYYAAGSFLGQYGNDGLSVLFLSRGGVSVAKDGLYRINCVFEGEKNEYVEAVYLGEPRYYRTDIEPEMSVVEYGSVTVFPTDVIGEKTVSHLALKFDAGDWEIMLVARVPKSVSGDIIPGRYVVGDEERAFTLTGIDSAVPCMVIHDGEVSDIISGTLKVTAEEDAFVYDGSFFDNKNRGYILRSKTHVYKARGNSIIRFLNIIG